jgi:transcriptional regulator with XRE-family HTH domain
MSTFWEELFAVYRERAYKPEPPMVYDFQIALDMLRRRSGLTLEQLGARIGCLPSAIAAHEAKNGQTVRPEMYAKLKRVAQDYDLPKMVNWFDIQERRAQTRRWRRGSEMTGRSEREYES